LYYLLPLLAVKQTSLMEKKLYRIPDQAVFGGVASGIAQYLQIDVIIVRVILVIMLLLPIIPPGFGMTGFIYVILWAVLPTGPAIAHSSTQDPYNPAHSNIPTTTNPKSEQTIMILGGVLVLFGIVMLVDDFPIWYQIREYFWPVALICVGAFLILRQRDKKNETQSNNYNASNQPVDIDPQPFTPPAAEEPENRFPQDPNAKPNQDDDDQIIRVN
jgi:phage shock protein C